MTVFTIKAPDGKTYKVKGANREGAIEFLKKQLGQPAPAAAAQPPAEAPAENPLPMAKGGSVEPEGWGQWALRKMTSPLANESLNADTINAAGAGATDMATAGFKDELMGGLDALTGKRSYAEGVDAARKNEEFIRNKAPAAYTAGQVAGGVATGTALEKAGATPTAAWLSKENPSLAGKMLTGSVEGATGGGLYGYGSGENTQDRINQMISGGLTGLGMGALIPAAGALISKGYKAYKNRAGNKSVKEMLGVDASVSDLLKGRIDADEAAGPVGEARIKAAGPDAMLADVGPNMQSILDVSIQKGDAGGTIAGQRIAERAERGHSALEAALDAQLGKPQGAYTAINQNRLGTSATRGAAYQKAYEFPMDYTTDEGKELMEIITKRVPKEAIAEAKKLMKIEGVDPSVLASSPHNDLPTKFKKLPTMQGIDYITRGINEVAEQANAKGKMGGTTDAGRAYGNLGKEIRDIARKMNPEYGTALDTAADTIKITNAVKLGQNAMSGNMARDEFADLVSQMEPPEKKALAQSIRGKVDETLSNITRSVADPDVDAKEAVKALKMFSSRAARDKLDILLGPDEAAKLTNELDRVAKSFDLRANVAQNSKTASRLMTEEAVKQDSGQDSVMNKIRSGEGIGTAKRIWQEFTGATPAAKHAAERKVFEQLSDVLTRPGAEALPAFRILKDVGQQRTITAEKAKQIEKMIRGLGRGGKAYTFGQTQ